MLLVQRQQLFNLSWLQVSDSRRVDILILGAFECIPTTFLVRSLGLKQQCCQKKDSL